MLKKITVSWLLLCGVVCGAAGEGFFAGGVWEFDGNLSDSSGNGLDGQGQGAVAFKDSGDGGKALHLSGGRVLVRDSPLLRLERGIEIATRVRLDQMPPGKGWCDLVMKGDYQSGGYVLRVNPVVEGSTFGFFVNTGSWERRVNSKQAVEVGRWYDIAAGWDDEGLWIRVDGEVARTAREGKPVTTAAPLRIGAFEGAMDFLRVSRPARGLQGVGFWPMVSSGKSVVGERHGWDIEAGRFLKGAEGGGLVMGGGPWYQADNEDFRLAPGLRVECLVMFEELPEDQAVILMKDGEYMLRLDSRKEGGCFSFFISVDGRWEPRVRDDAVVESGRWYRVVAGWDGVKISLSVDERVNTMHRAGVVSGKGAPLRLGSFKGVVRNVSLENPKPVTINISNLRTHVPLLQAGEKFEISGELFNYSALAAGCSATITLPEGMRCVGPAKIELPPLAPATSQSIGWEVYAETGMVANAVIRVEHDGEVVSSVRQRLAVFDRGATERAGYSGQVYVAPAGGSGTIYYVDSRDGDNGNDGRSKAAAWRDFSNVNGRTLRAGERLLLRAGSVFNQELQVAADGTPEAWAEIGSYGEGARPVIRRNRDIGERCVLIKNANYLAVRGLTLCFAGKGLIVHYDKPGCRGLVIEDCIAHHIEGIYRFNSHGIPEWLNRRGAEGDNDARSAGFAVSGVAASDIVLRDCEMYQCSQGFYMAGDRVLVERVFCHDNYTYNTSPHPVLANITRSVLQSSIFDAAGWHAHAGTMGIMLGSPVGLIIRDSHFLNQPDSGSSDQGGIDFEANGEGCLIDQCTFRNNAGAAIEVLGLRVPQTKSIEIRNSRFFRNNTALQLGPSEIFIWGGSRSPEICCSTGEVKDNGYVLHPGVTFFTNQAPATTEWKLEGNREYGSVAELEAAMPLNNPPRVEIEREIWSGSRQVELAAVIEDDGRGKGELAIRWEQMHGPGRVSFEEPDKGLTRAEFEMEGEYLLRVVVDDGELWRSAVTVVHIVEPEVRLLRVWGFEEVLDKQGWEAYGLNTQPQKWGDGFWSCVAKPVNYVGGGEYIFAVDKSREAALVSPDGLSVSLNAKPKIAVMLQNSSNAGAMRIEFVTEEEPEWSAKMSKVFAIKAGEAEAVRYIFDMGDVEGWRGHLKQVRFRPGAGEVVTGTLRIDYIYIFER